MRFELGEEDLKEEEEKKEEEQQQHGVQETPSNRMNLAIDNLEALEQVRIVVHTKNVLFLCLQQPQIHTAQLFDPFVGLNLHADFLMGRLQLC